jgi:hypothetical protein
MHEFRKINPTVMQRERTTTYTGIADSSFLSPYGCEQNYLAQLHGAIC